MYILYIEVAASSLPSLEGLPKSVSALSNPNHGSDLPHAIKALFELSRMDADEIEAAHVHRAEPGDIKSD